MTIADLTTEKIQTIGENIKIRRFTRYEGDVATYIHAGGSIGVMVKFDTDVADKEGFEEYGKDVAMQVAAANPGYLNETEVPAEVLEKEKEILKVQAINEGKPEAIAEKMVQGRIKKFYKKLPDGSGIHQRRRPDHQILHRSKSKRARRQDRNPLFRSL